MGIYGRGRGRGRSGRQWEIFLFFPLFLSSPFLLLLFLPLHLRHLLLREIEIKIEVLFLLSEVSKGWIIFFLSINALTSSTLLLTVLLLLLPLLPLLYLSTPFFSVFLFFEKEIKNKSFASLFVSSF